MGLGIAYVAANVTRLPVVLMDVSQAQTDKGMVFMGKNINNLPNFNFPLNSLYIM